MSLRRVMHRGMKARNIDDIRRAARAYYRSHGRHALPWRKTSDSYRILVSEVMLQQTQVPRVIEKYAEFLEAFPTVGALADAQFAQVLSVWSGLGYNRRARFLHEAARAVAVHHGGYVPREEAALCALPGIGTYTARAVRTFAYNEPAVLVETNIRAAVIHHCFPPNCEVHDRDVEAAVESMLPRRNPRVWYWALMDYGAHVKRMHKNPARRSAQYTRQSPFAGSRRQVRGAIVRALSGGPQTRRQLVSLGFPREQLDDALSTLIRDRLIEYSSRSFRLAA